MPSCVHAYVCATVHVYCLHLLPVINDWQTTQYDYVHVFLMLQTVSNYLYCTSSSVCCCYCTQLCVNNEWDKTSILE